MEKILIKINATKGLFNIVYRNTFDCRAQKIIRYFNNINTQQFEYLDVYECA